LTDKLIINAALTGMVPTKADTPHLPVTPEEIAADARRCRDAGAAIVHLHARDEAGKPTYRRERYEEILAAVRAVCPELILCVSTSGRVFHRFEERADVLDAGGPRSEMASLTLGSLNFARQASVTEPRTIKSLALSMRERGIMPELECFELGMVEQIGFLIERGILQTPGYCNLLLGSPGTINATALNLAMMVNALPSGITWAAAGIGRCQFRVNALAIAMGGHARVGLEDNIYYDEEKTLLATNASLIERLAVLAAAAGRSIASPDEARAMIGLPIRKRAA